MNEPQGRVFYSHFENCRYPNRKYKSDFLPECFQCSHMSMPRNLIEKIHRKHMKNDIEEVIEKRKRTVSKQRGGDIPHRSEEEDYYTCMKASLLFFLKRLRRRRTRIFKCLGCFRDIKNYKGGGRCSVPGVQLEQ